MVVRSQRPNLHAGAPRYENAYFVNLCQRGSGNASCFDQDGNALNTYACQTVKGWGYSVDLGTTIGFNPPPTNMTAEQGLTVTLEYGTYCNGARRPRTSYITLVCDPNAGVGMKPGRARGGGLACRCVNAHGWSLSRR